MYNSQEIYKYVNNYDTLKPAADDSRCADEKLVLVTRKKTRNVGRVYNFIHVAAIDSQDCR